MSEKRTPDTEAQQAAVRGPSADALLKRLSDAGVLKLDVPLGEVMRRLGGIEQDVGSLGLTVIINSDCYILVTKSTAHPVFTQ